MGQPPVLNKTSKTSNVLTNWLRQWTNNHCSFLEWTYQSST